jgi:hypothetical protein
MQKMSPFVGSTGQSEHYVRVRQAACELITSELVKGPQKGTEMRLYKLKNEEGKIGYLILWLLGVPVSLLLLIFLLRGCT